MAVSYIDFVEERLDIGIDYGAVGGMSFKTEIINNGAETEQRNCTRWLPLGRWQLGERLIYEGDDKSLNEVEYLKTFHAARKGSKQGFRFRDWTDYQGINQHIGTTDGVTTQWQLVKTYYGGDVNNITQRPIIKPVQGTVKLYLDGLEITFPSVDSSTGVITFAVPPSAGQIITADFVFDVAVTFEKDEISWDLLAVSLPTGEKLHKLGSVFVAEMKINLFSPWHDLNPLPDIILEPLDLGIILDCQQSTFFSTRSETLASGFKSSLSNRESERIILKLPTRKLNQEELNLILNYFWVCKGRLIGFFLALNNSAYWCRFNSDSLSIKFLHDEGLYEINNLDFYCFGDLNFIDNETYVSAIAPVTSLLPQDLNRIEDAMITFEKILKAAFYKTDSATAKYFDYGSNAEHRWLFNANTERRSSTDEPNKQVFFLWLREVNPQYHNTDGTAPEPTATFNSDLANFLATYNDRENFKVVIFSVFSNSYSGTTLSTWQAFDNHLYNALKAESGYTPALNDYNFTGKTITTDGKDATFFLKSIFT